MNIENKIDEAISNLNSGDFELGFSSLKELVLMYPNNDNVNYLLGYAYRKANKLEVSEIYIKKSIEINPNISQYYVGLGVTQQKQMKYDDAIISFESAIQIYPNNFDAYNSLGFTYRLKHDYEKALEIYSKNAMILFNTIYDKVVKNSNRLIPLVKVQKLFGDHEWEKLFKELVFLRASREGMEEIWLPNSEKVLKIEKETSYGAKMFIDDKKLRIILPNFFHNFAYELNSKLDYSLLINNVAATYTFQERIALARKFYLESILFTPEDQFYLPPHVGLQNLN